ncbi:52 kDa repressor of the inhibitor of the protein kinase-like isoform X3, partial [Aphis craccivora]
MKSMLFDKFFTLRSRGKPIKLIANFFPTTTYRDFSLYQHKVDFNPEEESINIKRGLLSAHKEFLGAYIFDGTMLFSRKKFQRDTVELTSKQNTDGKIVIMTIKFTAVIEKGDYTCIQIFNLLMRKSLHHLKLTLVGRNYYDADAKELQLFSHTIFMSCQMESSLNQDNFRAILKYRAYGDEYLKHIITILVDETTDISTIEQMAMCVRCVDSNDCIHERFLKFITINSLNSCEINLDYLYGQGYDGASNMSGQYKGVQAIIKKNYPKAIYVHCAAHSLNLAVSTASGIQPIRNCLGIIEKYYVFFNTPKRQNVLLTNIENSDEDPKVKTLKRLCATRWVQRYDAVTDFIELFAFVVESLENISNWNDSTATEANILLKAIDSEFLISLQVIQ